MTNDQPVEAFLASYPDEVQAIAQAARSLLAQVLPRITETVDKSAKLLGYSYGPGYKHVICTLIMSQSGVKLGIFRGAELPDPLGLLAGSGKVHRHVQLRNADDLGKLGLKQLLREAAAAWKSKTRDETPSRSRSRRKKSATAKGS